MCLYIKQEFLFYLFVLMAGRFFRADTLLSDASLNWRRIVREVRGMCLHLTA